MICFDYHRYINLYKSLLNSEFIMALHKDLQSLKIFILDAFFVKLQRAQHVHQLALFFCKKLIAKKKKCNFRMTT